MSAQNLTFAFAGSVQCERRGAQWLLAGLERTTRRPLRLVLVTSDSNMLPASVQELEVRGTVGFQPGYGPSRLNLRWTGGDSCELVVRSLHVQRAASVTLTAAMPGRAPSWRGRLGWALLLNLLRLPGMTRLLQALRGAG